MATTSEVSGARKAKTLKTARRLGKRVVHRKRAPQAQRSVARGSYELIGHVERGLNFNSVERLRQKMGIPMKAMAELLQIKSRTLLRRKEEGRLHPDESDRVLRASRLFSHAVELFDGNEGAARRWLLAPQRALGGRFLWNSREAKLARAK